MEEQNLWKQMQIELIHRRKEREAEELKELQEDIAEGVAKLSKGRSAKHLEMNLKRRARIRLSRAVRTRQEIAKEARPPLRPLMEPLLETGDGDRPSDPMEPPPHPPLTLQARNQLPTDVFLELAKLRAKENETMLPTVEVESKRPTQRPAQCPTQRLTHCPHSPTNN